MKKIFFIFSLLAMTGCAADQYHQQGSADLTVYDANRLCGNQALSDHPIQLSAAGAIGAGLGGAIGGAIGGAAGGDSDKASRDAEIDSCMKSHGWERNQ